MTFLSFSSFPSAEHEGVLIREQEILAAHCTYEVGGPADYFCEPSNLAELQAVLSDCARQGLPVTVIGKGSNLLIADRGIRGMVICLSDEFSRHGLLPAAVGSSRGWGGGVGSGGGLAQVSSDGASTGSLRPKPPSSVSSALDDYQMCLANLSVGSEAGSQAGSEANLQVDPLATPEADEDGYVWYFAEAGASMIDVSLYASSLGLTGLEFACGIPGTVGGALYMNAGAYGGSTEDVAAITWYLNDQGEILSASWDEQKFGYRRSFFQDIGGIVLGTCYRLKLGDVDEISETIADLTQRREKSQPLEMPSCGSVFKRPEGYYAGKLIMDSGLQGYRIGGAEVSRKHAGFIVNVGDATAQNIADLITYIQKTVKERFGVTLETEVRFIGEW